MKICEMMMMKMAFKILLILCNFYAISIVIILKIPYILLNNN